MSASKSFHLMDGVSQSANFNSDTVDLAFLNGTGITVTVSSASTDLNMDIYLEGSMSDEADFCEISGSRIFVSGNVSTGWNYSAINCKRIRVSGDIIAGSATVDIYGTVKAL